MDEVQRVISAGWQQNGHPAARKRRAKSAFISAEISSC